MGRKLVAESFDSCVYDVCLTRQNVTATLCENINTFAVRCVKEYKVPIGIWRNYQLCRELL